MQCVDVESQLMEHMDAITDPPHHNEQEILTALDTNTSPVLTTAAMPHQGIQSMLCCRLPAALI